MRTGHFGLLGQVEAIAAAGYDTAELHIWEIMALDNAGFAAAAQKIRDCGIPCEVFNNPLPMDISIAGEDFDLPFYREHMKRGVERVQALGGRYINFGNGRARSIPRGADRDAVVQKVLGVVDDLCGYAAQAEITVLLEPIGRSITNFVLTIAEAYDCAARLGRSNLKTLIDLRWFVDAPEQTWADVARYRDFIAHAHIDYPLSTLPERVESTLGDGYDYGPYIAALNSAGYDGILSTETNSHRDFEAEIREGLRLLRHYGVG